MLQLAVNMSPISRFYVGHQYAMRNIKQELCNLPSYRFLADLESLHRHGSVPLSNCLQQCELFTT